MFTETSTQKRKSGYYHFLVLRLIMYDQKFWPIRSTYPLPLPHILIVDIYHLWLFDINFFSLFPTKSLNDCFRLFPAKVEITLIVLLSSQQTAAILDVVSGINQLHILIPRRYSYNTFIHICLIGRAIQSPHIVFKIIENARLCQ